MTVDQVTFPSDDVWENDLQALCKRGRALHRSSWLCWLRRFMNMKEMGDGE